MRGKSKVKGQKSKVKSAVRVISGLLAQRSTVPAISAALAGCGDTFDFCLLTFAF